MRHAGVHTVPAAAPPCADRGSGTVWTLAFIAMVWLTATVVMTAGGVRAARHQAHTAADLAALAAAAHAAGGPGTACRWAAAIAAGSGGRLSGCAVRGRVVDVLVVVTVPGPKPLGPIRLVARARAGPAGAGT